MKNNCRQGDLLGVSPKRVSVRLASVFDTYQHARDLTGERRLLAVVFRERLEKVLEIMLDENEFLSPYGIRALSRFHKDNPYILHADGEEYRVDYEPGDGSTGLFGGNSNWRGPVWFPVNYLIIESLQKFDYYFGDDFKIECPTGSGVMMTLWKVSQELSHRLSSCAIIMANVPPSETMKSSKPTSIFGTISFFMNIFTAKTDRVSVPAIKRVGRLSSPNSCTKAVNNLIYVDGDFWRKYESDCG